MTVGYSVSLVDLAKKAVVERDPKAAIQFAERLTNYSYHETYRAAKFYAGFDIDLADWDQLLAEGDVAR